MRRKCLVNVPKSKDVCIFCAARLQFAFLRPTAPLYRRPFSSTTAAGKPPSAAVANHQTDDVPYDNGGWRRYSPWEQQSYNSRVPAEAPRDLTAEEQRLRDSLKSKPQPSVNGEHAAPGLIKKFTAQERHPLSFKNRRRDWRCRLCQYKNYSRNQTCFRCRHGRSGLPVGATTDQNVDLANAIDLKAKSQYMGNENITRTKNRPPTMFGETEAERVKNWKHVRRRDSPAISDQQQEQKSERSREQAPDFVKTETAAAKAQAAEQASMTRLENTKDGKYVGLHYQGRPTTAKSSQAVGSATPRDDSARLSDNDGWVHWQPSGTDLTEEAAKPTDRSISQNLGSREALDSWEYPIEDHSAKHAGNQIDSLSQESIESGPKHKQDQKTRRDIGIDPEFIQTVKRSNQTASKQEHGPRFRGSGIEAIRAPSNERRQRERKSKKSASAIDEIEDDEDVRAERRAERRKQREKTKAAQKAAAPPTPVYLPEFISVSNLAGVLKVRVEDFIRKMKDLGFDEINNDHVLDAETAGLVAVEFNFEPIVERIEDKDLLPLPPAEDKSTLPPRPPVVTIMGHVDHGKTTMLDYLRKSSVAASEHGGITQHIGAFSVRMTGGRFVTFLDTPGHEAFLSMRQRGANVTDIVILVVAADDSVKPQTIEAIKHAQAAKVPMIVAVNKIDKEDSNVERVKQDLSRYGVEIEDYGGDTQVVCVSGKTGQGMGELEDAAVALADILDMRSEIDGQAEGWVLEATTKKAGRVATILVRRGTLRPGDYIVAGTSWARIRSLRNEAGAMVRSAGPGTPVEIDGWREQPSAGDEVIQAPDEQKAKSVIEYRLEASERTKLAADMEAVNESRRLEQERREQLERAAELAEANPDNAPATSQTPQTSAASACREVFFIIKADVSGSVEAVTNSVSALGNSEIRPHILRSGVGPVTEFDIDHAAVAKGQIINFNTAIEGPIRRTAENKGVRIIDQSIIYRLVDDVKAALSEQLPETVTQRVLGEAEIAQIFEINTKGRIREPVAGCKVRNGVIGRTAKIRVLRDKETIFNGSLSSLKNVKKDVTEMRKGNECGMAFENWSGFKVSDQVQAYEESVEKRTL
ncbi:translation initiation factor IF-2 [Lecanora helva]